MFFIFFLFFLSFRARLFLCLNFRRHRFVLLSDFRARVSSVYRIRVVHAASLEEELKFEVYLFIWLPVSNYEGRFEFVRFNFEKERKREENFRDDFSPPQFETTPHSLCSPFSYELTEL